LSLAGKQRAFGLGTWLLVAACSGATGGNGGSTPVDAESLPRLSAGPPPSQTLGVDLCVFGPAGRSELTWRVTASARTTITLWLVDRRARVGAQRVPIDDREINGKSVPLQPNVPHEFKLLLGDDWTPNPGDTLAFDLMARFPNGAQVQVPNSACTVPAPPPP
jgi:hypothetical protein